MYRLQIRDIRYSSEFDMFFKEKAELFSSLSLFLQARGQLSLLNEIISSVEKEGYLNCLYGREELDIVISSDFTTHVRIANLWTPEMNYDVAFVFPIEGHIIKETWKEFSEKYENCDSFRVCDPSDRSAMKKYNEYVSTCCCGSIDKRIKIYGRELLIGANYGH